MQIVGFPMRRLKWNGYRAEKVLVIIFVTDYSKSLLKVVRTISQNGDDLVCFQCEKKLESSKSVFAHDT